MFFFSRVNHASMSLWDENSTSLLYSHIPSSAGTWRIFTNMLCQCFFRFSWHFKREKSVFWKASFFAIQELMTLARIRVKDFVTGENKFSKHWRHQILQGPLESFYKASCWDFKDFYIGKTKRSFRDRKVSLSNWDVGRTLEKLVNQAFIVFCQHPAWLITAVNP